MNLTKNEVRLFTSLFAGTGSISALATFILFLLTFLTSTRENMKLSEKILIYNVVLTDMIFEVIVLAIITPSIRQNEWTFSDFKTSWIAFTSTTCMFHGHAAIVYITDLIVLSLTDSYRFHASDNLRQMAALVVSTICISICFCSLPACEQSGYVFSSAWLAPSFNLQFQYGSIFMVMAMFGLLIAKQFKNLFSMIQVRNFFIVNSDKMTTKAMKDMEKLIQFNILSIVSIALSLLSLIGGLTIIATIIIELILILNPVVRAVLLYFMCPHFHFGTSESNEELMEEYAIISAEVNDMHIEAITSPRHTEL